MALHEPDGVLVSDRAARVSVDPGVSPVGLGRLWGGVLLAPGAWVMLLLIGYFFASRSCEANGGVPFRGTTSPSTTHVIISVIMLAVAAWGLLLAVGNWRTSRRQYRPGDPAAWGRAEFMSVSGVIASALFLFGVALTGFAGFVVRACSQLRQ